MNYTFLDKINILKIIGVLFLFILSFYILKQKTSIYKQFAKHNQITIEENEEDKALFYKAVEYFNDGKYKSAIPKIDNYLMQNPDNLKLKIALGICFLETDKIEEAQILFSQVYGLQNNYKNQAAWYMALSYLKLKDMQQTKAFLGDIEPSSSYYNKAQELRKLL